ncbi:hypothetical protein BX600DRAFT_511343 [Xylariales sp. PMI_506]|nr:hypothetical protein BX600DRAFT_511343 [Xylariales sp. PMI_506]
MTSLKRALLAALKSLLRGRSYLKALFSFWLRPSPLRQTHANGKTALPKKTIDEFLKEAEQQLLGPIQGDSLTWFSKKIKLQFRERLQDHPESMLPSFSHLLPTGNETGPYLALDVGGSTLRVALVILRGREAVGKESEILRMDSFKITPDVKKLEGMSFFDWMAARINEVVKDDVAQRYDSNAPIPMGLAWSFPVEYDGTFLIVNPPSFIVTSSLPFLLSSKARGNKIYVSQSRREVRPSSGEANTVWDRQISLGGGLLLGMGKGFMATNGLLGQDLGGIIQIACRKHGLNVELSAIVNDGSATLLSQAYVHSQTRFGLILGTGVNIAVHLPVSALHRTKFGSRPDSWFESASHVIVNTELGMYGHDILPRTRWDKELNAALPRPDFQPLEYFLSGYYLGEIVRLALVEAVETAGVFGGVIPPSLETPYSLETETLSLLEADTTPNFETALPHFAAAHPSANKPTTSDLSVIRALATFVSRRSAALLAASVFSLWELRLETEAEYIRSQTPASASTTVSSTTTTAPSSFIAQAEKERALPRTKVAFNGSVIERYPGYRDGCQAYLNDLIAVSGHPGAVELVPALESSILGAAVALACAIEGGKDVQQQP